MVTERIVGEWWRYLVSAVGCLLLAVGVVSVFLDGRLTGGEARLIASLVVLCALLIVLGTRIALDIDATGDAVRVLAWMSGGVLALGALGAWARVVVPSVGSRFQIMLVFLSVLAAGALFGAVVGYYNVRERRLVERASREAARREFLDEQRTALSTLNGILRHQILNDVSAISGRAELLDAGKIEREAAIDSIIDHCDHMADTVSRIETVVDVVTWVTETTDEAAEDAIDRARATLREEHPQATVTVDGDTAVTVEADELLSLALYEVLANAVTHGQQPVSVTVRASDDRVVIGVSDAGDEVPVAVDRLFEPNTRGAASSGDGLGLFLADLVVDRYDGSVRLREESPTTFEIEVPRARPAADR